MQIEFDSKLNKIIASVASNYSETDKRVILLNGMFGVGKSSLIEKLKQITLETCVVDAIVLFPRTKKVQFLTEYLSNCILLLNNNYNTNDDNYFYETTYNKNRFNDLTELVRNYDASFYNSFSAQKTLKSIPELIMFRNTSNNDFINFEDKINQIIEKKGDKRLLLNTGTVAAESLIVDLMNNLYHLTDNNISFQELPSQPKKILFLIDDTELEMGSIIEWLNNKMFKYSFEFTFNDFICYDIKSFKTDTKIAEYFDFRFVVSSRISPINVNLIENLFENKSLLKEVVLEPLTKIQMKIILENESLDVEKFIDLIQQYTNGIPFLIDLWLNIVKNGRNNFSSIAQYAMARIFKNKTETEFIWLRCAAYLEEFDEIALWCFPQIAHRYNDAFIYLKNNFEFTSSSKFDDNKIVFNPILKEIIKNSSKADYPDLDENYHNISSIYSMISLIKPKLNVDELNSIRQLAYFKRFDKEETIDAVFNENSPKVRSIVNSKPELFISDSKTMSLKDEIANPLIQLNKLIDYDRFMDNLEQVRNICSIHTNKIQESLDKNIRQITYIKDEKTWFEKKAKSKEQTYHQLKQAFLETENEIIGLRKQIEIISKWKVPRIGLIALGIGLLIAIFQIFIPGVWGSLFKQNSQSIIPYLTYPISTLLFLYGSYVLIKSIINKTFKKSADFIHDCINKSETDKSNIQSEMNSTRQELDDIEFRFKEMDIQVNILQSHVEELQEKLLELPEPISI